MPRRGHSAGSACCSTNWSLSALRTPRCLLVSRPTRPLFLLHPSRWCPPPPETFVRRVIDRASALSPCGRVGTYTTWSGYIHDCVSSNSTTFSHVWEGARRRVLVGAAYQRTSRAGMFHCSALRQAPHHRTLHYSMLPAHAASQ